MCDSLIVEQFIPGTGAFPLRLYGCSTTVSTGVGPLSVDCYV